MTHNPSQDLYEETFGSPDDQAEPSSPTYGDPSLEYLDRRDVQLEYWRWGGLYFFATLIGLGKAWVVAAQALLLVGMVVLGLLGLWPVSIALLVVALVLAYYEYTSLDQWTDEYNERVSTRREAAKRKGG